MTVQSPPPPPGYPPPGYPQPPQAPPPQKSGMGPLGWVLIGCGVIVVICLLVMGACFYIAKNKLSEFQKNPGFSAAKLVVQANPDLDLVSSDETAGTLTIRNKKTNETVTVNFDDVKNGKMRFSTDKGSVDISQNGVTMKSTDAAGHTESVVAGAAAPTDMPSWLPVYPGATVKGGFSASSDQGATRSFTITTSDPVDKVLSFYQDQLKANGLAIANTMNFAGQGNSGLVSAANADKTRSVQIMVSTSSGQTSAYVTYTEKK